MAKLTKQITEEQQMWLPRETRKESDYTILSSALLWAVENSERANTTAIVHTLDLIQDMKSAEAKALA